MLFRSGDKGVSAPVTSSGIAVTAAKRAQIDITDAALQGAGDNKVRYYRVYRSTKGGAAGTAKFMWHFPTNTNGAGGGTRLFDDNTHIPNTSPVYLGECSTDVMFNASLLDFLRRPFGQVVTTVPFALMKFFSLHVRIPKRWWIFDNCARAA